MVCKLVKLNIVEHINDLDPDKYEVKLTHRQGSDNVNGWTLLEDEYTLNDFIIHIGCCKIDGDIFAVYRENIIVFYKGKVIHKL